MSIFLAGDMGVRSKLRLGVPSIRIYHIFSKKKKHIKQTNKYLYS